MIQSKQEITPLPFLPQSPAVPTLAVQHGEWLPSQGRVAPPLPLSEGDRQGPEEFRRLLCAHRVTTQKAHHRQVIRCRTDLQKEAVAVPAWVPHTWGL